MIAPDCNVQTVGGKQVKLAKFYQSEPLVLVFLRHFGCAFCREQLHALAEVKAQVVYVCQMEPDKAKVYVDEIGLTSPLLCDPKRELFLAFGLELGSFSQVVNPRVVARSLKAIAHGNFHHRPPSDPRQLGGLFIVDQSGEVRYSYKSADISDIVPAGTVLAQLERITAENSQNPSGTESKA